MWSFLPIFAYIKHPNAYCVLIYSFSYLNFTITSTVLPTKRSGKASWKLSESSEGYGIGLNSLAINLWLNGGPAKGKPMEIRHTIWRVWWINSSRFFSGLWNRFVDRYSPDLSVKVMFAWCFFLKHPWGLFRTQIPWAELKVSAQIDFCFMMSTEIPNVVQT